MRALKKVGIVLGVLVGLFIIVGVVAIATSDGEGPAPIDTSEPVVEEQEPEPVVEEQEPEPVVEESEPEEVAEEEPIEEPTVEEKPDGATLGERNALGCALGYLDCMPFSHSGLVEQLEYEGYTHGEAVYGADNCGADWNEQAASSAKGYLDLMSFSRDGLIAQLEYEGFTHQQAEYGVQAVGY